MTTRLSQLLASAALADGALTLEVPADWMQGRSVFGGLQAALALQAMRSLVPDVPLRTLQTTFVAPIPAGPVHVHAKVLRTGKNATQVEARIGDGATTQALAIGVFGSARRSAIARAPAPIALAPSTTPVLELPFGAGGAGGSPSFAAHFSARWLLGQPPFMGGSDTSQVLELGIDDPGTTREAHILAIADFIPPVALSLLKQFAPGSTVTWMLELLVDRVDHLPKTGFRIEAEMVAARDGYTSQAVKMFGPNGEPIALSHQSMLVFD